MDQAQYLMRLWISHEGREESVAFALIYLDGDHVPELVVMDGNAHLCDVFAKTERKRFDRGRRYGCERRTVDFLRFHILKML